MEHHFTDTDIINTSQNKHALLKTVKTITVDDYTIECLKVIWSQETTVVLVFTTTIVEKQPLTSTECLTTQQVQN